MTPTTAIVQTTGAALPTVRIVPMDAVGSQKSKLGQYDRWLQATGRTWASPGHTAYRDHIIKRLAPKSAAGCMSTVRAQCKRIRKSNDADIVIVHMAHEDLERRGIEPSPANVEAFVGRFWRRYDNEIDPELSKVKTEKVADKVDAAHGTRLTRDQASALMASPGTGSLIKLRDTAILAMFLCTGIREQELCNLDVSDLRQTIDGTLCLHVRHGKGNKTRAVVYGGNEWVLTIVDKWLESAGIKDGPVFRGSYKGGRLRSGRLTTRSIQKIVSGRGTNGKRRGGYPVMIDGVKTTIHPHDLRRTYARIWYDMGGDLVGLQQNLGHADLKTTLHYIGVLDVSKRSAPSMYSFDWQSLDAVAVQGAAIL